MVRGEHVWANSRKAVRCRAERRALVHHQRIAAHEHQQLDQRRGARAEALPGAHCSSRRVDAHGDLKAVKRLQVARRVGARLLRVRGDENGGVPELARHLNRTFEKVALRATAVCMSCVERHGAQVDADDRSLGAGSQAVVGRLERLQDGRMWHHERAEELAEGVAWTEPPSALRGQKLTESRVEYGQERQEALVHALDTHAGVAAPRLTQIAVRCLR
mmetsp:Transcript_4088/g.13718  ORF Transcript_4088/g.13718 Transcript_4088/m.13718 type:complete len:218 (-) Transcript_4088:657-1310(-)